MASRQREGRPARRRAAGALSDDGQEGCRQLIDGPKLPPRSVADDEWSASDPDHCVGLPDFGLRQHEEDGNGDRFDKILPRPGTRSFSAGSSLPPSENNVVVRSLYVSPSGRSICVEFDYPSG